MALPKILAQAARQAARKQFVQGLGRTVYRDARGRMINYQTYKQLRSDAVSFEAQRRKEWGKPPPGWSWTRIAQKYPERMAGYV